MNIQAVIMLADQNNGEPPTPESLILGILPHTFSDDREPEATNNDDNHVFSWNLYVDYSIQLVTCVLQHEQKHQCVKLGTGTHCGF